MVYPYFWFLNPFVPNEPFLYPLKTLESHKVFWCLQGLDKGCMGMNGLTPAAVCYAVKFSFFRIASATALCIQRNIQDPIKYLWYSLVTVITYLFRSLFLFEVEEMMTSRFKGIFMQIIQQQINHRSNRANPKSFTFRAFLIFKLLRRSKFA